MHAAADADTAVSARLDALVGALRAAGGNALVAVVLGGSLARGEGTVLGTPAGPRLLSDIDLYAVLEPGALARRGEILAAARRAVAGDPFLLAPLDLGAVAPDGFLRLGRTLPAFQLASAHAVLWEAHTRWSRPAPPAGGTAALDPDDALCLLHNRFAEHLLAGARARLQPPDPWGLFHAWKMWMDAPLAWLAAHGRYVADRNAQLRALEEAAAGLTGEAAAWLRDGSRVALQMLAAMREGPLTLPLLLTLPPAMAGPGRDPQGGDAPGSHQARAELIRWTWPFYRATMERCLADGARGDSSERPGAAAPRLAAAVALGAPCSADALRTARWLRRAPLWRRLRQARRWAPLAPQPLSLWWRHGFGGAGPDRMYVAAALRFARVEQWTAPLQGLIRGGPRGGGGASADETDAWLGGLWSGWVMGGARQ